MATEAIPEQIGPYKIVGVLGKGGMGMVYRAYKPPLPRQVAVKIIKAEFMSTPSALERFRREAELASELKHPNIVTVYDYEEVPGGDSYIVTELIEGGLTLRDRLQQGKLTYAEISNILNQISSALDYAYESRHIVHRDIKPSNIFFEANKRIALGDFGIAKDVSRSTQLTGMGEGIGTPDYMSPEQAMGEQLDRRSDIYSLGVVLFEMLSGTLPFTGDTPITVVMGHIQKPIPSLRSIDPNIPPAIEAVVKKAMAKKPDERYATAGDLAKAFAAAVEGKEEAATVALNPGATRPQSNPTQPQTNAVNQELGAVTMLEGQGRYQDAFNKLYQLRQQYPQDNDVNARFSRYTAQGYTFTGAMPTQPYNTPQPTNYVASTTPARPYTPQPNNYQYPQPTPAPTNYNTGQPTPPKKSSLPLILGGIGALVAVVVVVLIIALAGGGSKNNPTATVQAAVTPTVAPTTAPPTTAPVTTAPVTTRPATTAPVTTAPVTTAPVTTRPATTAPVTTAPVGSTGTNASRAAALNEEGEKLLDASNVQGAIDKFKQAIALDPSNASYHDSLTRAYLQVEDYALAENEARLSISLDPKKSDYRNNLGVALSNQGKKKEAEEQYREALKLEPNVALYNRNLASVLNDQDKYDQALDPARKAVSIDGKDPKNHNILGLVLQNLEKYAEAETEYRAAIQLDPKSALYQNNLSSVLNDQDKYALAEVEARKSITLDPKYALAYYNLAIALRNQSKYDEALTTARKSVELDPQDGLYNRELASLLNYLKQYEEAERVARNAVKYEPTSARGNSILGDVLYNRKNYQEAAKYYQEAIRLNPNYAPYYTYLGDTYVKLADYPKARDAYNQALKIDPSNADAKKGLDDIKGK